MACVLHLRLIRLEGLCRNRLVVHRLCRCNTHCDIPLLCCIRLRSVWGFFMHQRPMILPTSFSTWKRVSTTVMKSAIRAKGALTGLESHTELPLGSVDRGFGHPRNFAGGFASRFGSPFFAFPFRIGTRAIPLLQTFARGILNALQGLFRQSRSRLQQIVNLRPDECNFMESIVEIPTLLHNQFTSDAH